MKQFLPYNSRNVFVSVLFLGLIFGIQNQGFAGIPQQINIQGQVTDTTGNPVADGNYDFTFSLYSVSTGGTAIFTESTTSYPVTNGIFSYLLGTNNTLALPFGVPYWLGVSVDTDSEMSPRQKIVSVGNAFKAWNSDSATVAVYAITADNASTANHATTADSATNATNATNATSASSATYATTAGTATTLVSAANISTGTLDDSRLSANVPLLDSSNTWTGSQIFNNLFGIEMTNNGQGALMVAKNTQGRSLENGMFIGCIANDNSRRILFGYDTSTAGEYGYINAGISGVAWKNLILQSEGGNIGIGTVVPSEKLTLWNGNIALNSGYTVDGVDISQQNATWLGSTASQTLTAATYYDVVTSVNYVNGGVNVAWTAPFTQAPSVTTGIQIKNAGFISARVYSVQWTALTSSTATFRVVYNNAAAGFGGEASTNDVAVMINAVGK